MPRLPAALLALLLAPLSLASLPAAEPKSPVPALAPKADPAAQPAGVAVEYRLPTDGPLPRTWRVTLAITDAANPDWLISQFAAGEVVTVTSENQGRFTATWDGLDDNHMPVPPGTYGVKGICMPAAKWEVDGAYHSVTPRFLTEASAFQTPLEPWSTPGAFGGDPVGSPLRDVAVGPNGVAVFYYQYLENGTNNPMVDLTKPAGRGQFIRAFPSGGAAGGSATTTDGITVWSHSGDGGRKFVYRADQKPFGTSAGAYRKNVYVPDGVVTAMACQRNGEATTVYVAQGGRMVEAQGTRKTQYIEDPKDRVDTILALAGADGTLRGSIALPRPIGLAVQGGALWALHAATGAEAAGWTVSSVALQDGLPQGTWQRRFALPAGLVPHGFAVDGHGRIYISDPAQNHVFQFDAAGKALRTFGRAAAQASGAYDRATFMRPGKLAAWTAPDGGDRLLVVDMHGPNRISEWTADGAPVRDFLSLQTKANDGWVIDPEHPTSAYIAGQGGWLTRFALDVTARTWTVDAVWPLAALPGEKEAELDHPQLLRANGREYLAGARNYVVYRHDGDAWKLSAALLRSRVDNKAVVRSWHDANGDGAVQDDECAPLDTPRGVLRYHGEQWLDDLSLAAIGQGTRDVWRLAPASFDAHGNPVFSAWTKVLTDPVFAARAAGTADAVHGGNELVDVFNHDWGQVDGSPAEGFWVNARGGPSFSANFGSQHKLSRYVPDGKGGYALKWRTGRIALGGSAKPGEIIGAIHMRRPLNGILALIDQSRCGVLLYNEDGLYVDTLFPDGRIFRPDAVGVYALPGEFFAGAVVPDRDTGRILMAFGKYTPQLFTVDGWSLKDTPVHKLVAVQPTVTIAASQIAAPPELALGLRGGVGTARVAEAAPAVGGAALDGSLDGWESCDPVTFQADKERTVEVRVQYDPGHLLLRWHVRLGTAVSPRPLAPIERIFTHDRLADTVSFYLQGDPAAKPGGPRAARPGDARVVFGLFDDNGKVVPAALGMFPAWSGPGASPQRYETAAGGLAAFAHVGPLAGARLGHAIDKDGKGFVLAAELPRAAFPGLPPFTAGLRTLANFEATFGGHAKVWWADSDGSASRETYDEPTEARLYPGSWAPLRFRGIDDGVVLRRWQICGPFGGPGAEAFSDDPQGKEKDRVRAFYDAADYAPDSGEVDLAAVFSGPVVKGWWKGPASVRWKAAETVDLDTRVVLGQGASLWYGATWIEVPEETEVTFSLRGHPQTFLTFHLDDKQLFKGLIKGERASPGPMTEVKATLHAGWNQMRFRGYCTGYAPFRAGVVVKGDVEDLWRLHCSNVPPAGGAKGPVDR